MNGGLHTNFPAMIGKWYGFDLDGTIADNSAHNFGLLEIGKPIKPMCNLMKRLHNSGCRVKIFTARLNDLGSDGHMQQSVKKHIWEWCDKNLGFRPEITDKKDGMMECLFDDRAKQVVRDKGLLVEDLNIELANCLSSLRERVPKTKQNAAILKQCKELLMKCR